MSQPTIYPRFAAGVGAVSLLTLAGGAPLAAEYLLLLVVVALCTLPHSLPPRVRAWCHATRALPQQARPHLGLWQAPDPTSGLSTATAVTPARPIPARVHALAITAAASTVSTVQADHPGAGPGLAGELWQAWLAEAEHALTRGRGSDYRYAVYRLGLLAQHSADARLVADVKRVAHQQFALESAPESQTWLLLQLRRLAAERPAATGPGSTAHAP